MAHATIRLNQSQPAFVTCAGEQEVGFAPESRAVTFDDCAGILHPAFGALAIVMVQSFGYEALASMKAFRLLAEQLATAGFPCLRFHFPGTGDSIGDEAAKNLVEMRRASIVSACRYMREMPGIEGIVLLGFRLGASLAATVASECKASHLVLVEPPVAGKTWLREQDLLPRLAGIAVPPRSGSEGGREYMGYVMSEASHSAISALDLAQVSLRGVRRCLILSGSRVRRLSDCVSHWRSENVCVDQGEFADFSRLMADPALGGAPIGSLQPILTWLGSPPVADKPIRADSTEAALVGEDFTERGLYFGGTARRYGVLCEPSAPDAARPIVVLPNTGGNPHTGWGRQTVDLARRLAGMGVASFRIDVNGIGETADIAGRPSRLVYVPTSREDVVAAIDYLEQLRYTNVAVIGICSGAYLAYQASLCDARIRAMQLINLQKFEWGEDDKLVLYRSVSSYLSMLREPAVWRRIMTGEIDLADVSAHIAGKLLGKIKARFSRMLSFAWLRNKSVTATPLDHFKRHLENGMLIGMAYSDGDGGIDEAEMFLGSEGRYLSSYAGFSWETISGSGHNFETLADFSKLTAIVGQFAKLLMSRPARSGERETPGNTWMNQRRETPSVVRSELLSRDGT